MSSGPHPSGLSALSRRLTALSIGLLAAGVSAQASTHRAQSGASKLIDDLHKTVGAAAAWSGDAHSDRVLSARKRIDDALEMIAALSGDPCDEAAALYLSTSLVLGELPGGAITLEIAGAAGSQQFTFSSGTPQEDIAAAINGFREMLGVSAAQSPVNPQRIELRSTSAGTAAFVSAQQMSQSLPVIFPEPARSTGVYRLTDHGRDGLYADVNCDWAVNGIDLSLVIEQWGSCPAEPGSCTADINADGTVNVDDLWEVVLHWGRRG